MKVYISRPRSKISINRLSIAWYEKKFNKDIWNPKRIKDSEKNFKDKIVDYGLNTIQKILDLTVNKIRESQRSFVHIDSHDTWDCDYTLALIIAPLLKKLREESHGAPNIDDQDVPEQLRRPSKPENTDSNAMEEMDPYWHTRWDWILSEMIWAFEQIASQDSREKFFYQGDPEKDFDNFLSNKTEEINQYKSTYWFDSKGYEVYSARIDNGIRLFSKYFRAMWT